LRDLKASQDKICSEIALEFLKMFFYGFLSLIRVYNSFNRESFRPLILCLGYIKPNVLILS
jgi:hypothetical protein